MLGVSREIVGKQLADLARGGHRRAGAPPPDRPRRARARAAHCWRPTPAAASGHPAADRRPIALQIASPLSRWRRPEEFRPFCEAVRRARASPLPSSGRVIGFIRGEGDPGMRLSALTAAAASSAAAAVMVIGTPAAAQTEQQWDSCYGIGVPADRRPPEILISGCTAVIRAGIYGGHNLAVAFANRGLGYRQTSPGRTRFGRLRSGDRDRLGLPARLLPARSLFWERGDFEHARQDLDQIDRLKRLEAVLSAEEIGPGEASDRRRQTLAATGNADQTLRVAVRSHGRLAATTVGRLRSYVVEK